MKKYELASRIFEEQFNQVRNSITKTLSFLQEHSEMEVFSALKEAADDIFECFEAEYNEIRANDSYMISDAIEKTASPLMAFWQEQVEYYNVEIA